MRRKAAAFRSAPTLELTNHYRTDFKMKVLKTLQVAFAVAAFFFPFPASADETVDKLKAEVERLRKDNQRLARREKFSEVVVPRGNPQNIRVRTITVFVPENASNIQIKAYMKNEPWGGAQNPPKPNTDDMGPSVYKECPMGSGECPISWSKVSGATTTSLPNGRTQISADFYNWVGRNDRTGKLVVTYQVD